jgi:hypothetical protein
MRSSTQPVRGGWRKGLGRDRCATSAGHFSLPPLPPFGRARRSWGRRCRMGEVEEVEVRVERPREPRARVRKRERRRLTRGPVVLAAQPVPDRTGAQTRPRTLRIPFLALLTESPASSTRTAISVIAWRGSAARVHVPASVSPASVPIPARSTAAAHRSRQGSRTGPTVRRASRRPAAWTGSATGQESAVTSPLARSARPSPAPTQPWRATTHPRAVVTVLAHVRRERRAPAEGRIVVAGRSARRRAPGRPTARRARIAQGQRASRRRLTALFVP